jgi:hypothetical protein
MLTSMELQLHLPASLFSITAALQVDGESFQDGELFPCRIHITALKNMVKPYLLRYRVIADTSSWLLVGCTQRQFTLSPEEKLVFDDIHLMPRNYGQISLPEIQIQCDTPPEDQDIFSVRYLNARKQIYIHRPRIACTFWIPSCPAREADISTTNISDIGHDPKRPSLYLQPTFLQASATTHSTPSISLSSPFIANVVPASPSFVVATPYTSHAPHQHTRTLPSRIATRDSDTHSTSASSTTTLSTPKTQQIRHTKDGDGRVSAGKLHHHSSQSMSAVRPSSSSSSKKWGWLSPSVLTESFRETMFQRRSPSMSLSRGGRPPTDAQQGSK